ncbi:transglycosylase SLT domain-containing protein [Kineococcus sp. SYSU DK002]|uniref:transglycosylase SLT domain-containing protein n=1 Tax=Kineococcus sp. SYSU DK002 TaxID=3383123 RepID=UPI003D7DA123
MSVAEIQSRIAAIEARIAQFTGTALGQTLATATPVLASSASSATSAPGASSAFADVLSTTGSGASGAAGVLGRGLRSLNDSSAGQQLLAVAQQYTGTPYKWGGTTPAGFDCSGLVQYAGKQVGLTLPRTAAQQAKVGTEVPSLAQARAGDLVVLENGHHIGIYVGDGKMLHAPKAGDVVKISKVWETPMTIRRLGTALTTGVGTTAAGVALAAGALTGVASTQADSSSYVRPASLSATAAKATAKSAPYEAAFAAAEQQHGLPAGLLRAVAKQESGFNPNAKSPAGATGLMQFMPATARSLGIDPRDPFASIDAAGKYLATQLKTFGSVPLALAAYNAGPGNVKKHGGIPPFAETQNYVKKITADLGSAA